MLRAASLPPSMALREKKRPKEHLCPRSYRDFNIDETLVREVMSSKSNRKSKSQVTNCIDEELRELEKLEHEFVRRSPKYYKNKRRNKVCRCFQYTSKYKSLERNRYKRCYIRKNID